MTTSTEPSAARTPGRVRATLRDGMGIAVAMAVMNVTTYGFQMIAARILGPAEYGAIAGLMAVLMLMAVQQLSLQATAARRIAAEPHHVDVIEREMLRSGLRSGAWLCGALLLASPLVARVLGLDSVLSAVLLALTAIPLTVMGAQAGVLQGERRWLPLAGIYLGVGVPRLVLGTLCILVVPTEASAMLGVFVGLLVPASVGWWALRHPRTEPAPVAAVADAEDEDDTVAAAAPAAPAPTDGDTGHGRASIRSESLAGTIALLAFFALSNLDIVVARAVLDDHDAGLYAGGLIVTKAVLFLPQFVVVVLFPSLSTSEERQRALSRGLVVVGLLGAACVAGAYLLSGIAVVFVGGPAYAEVEPVLWLFALLGGLLSTLQLLVYSGLARDGAKATWLIWIAVVALVGLAALADSLVALLATVTAVDAVTLLVVLAMVTRLTARDSAEARAAR